MSTSIESLVAEYTKVKENFIEKSKNAMRTAFKEFFEINPDIDQVSWTQYTPYFNDGDPCIFRVSEMGFTLASDKVDLDDRSYPEDTVGFYGNSFYAHGDQKTDPVKEYRTVFSNFYKKINTLPDEIFSNSFGDGVKIIATQSGFDVQGYDHD